MDFDSMDSSEMTDSWLFVGGGGLVLLFKKSKQKLDNFQFLSVFVNDEGSVIQDVNNIKNSQ